MTFMGAAGSVGDDDEGMGVSGLKLVVIPEP